MKHWNVFPNTNTKIFVSKKLLENLDMLYKKVGTGTVNLENMSANQAIKMCKTLLIYDLSTKEYSNEQRNHYLLKLWKIIATHSRKLEDYSLHIGNMRKNNELVARQSIDEMIFVPIFSGTSSTQEFATQMIKFVTDLYQINPISVSNENIQKVLDNFKSIYYKLFGDEGNKDEVMEALKEIKKVTSDGWDENITFKIREE